MRRASVAALNWTIFTKVGGAELCACMHVCGLNIFVRLSHVSVSLTHTHTLSLCAAREDVGRVMCADAQPQTRIAFHVGP